MCNNPPATPPLNFVKLFANNNVCYLCGFDVKEGHTSVMCPRVWQKKTHQEAYTRENAQGYIAAGLDACTKGKHKNLFPGFRQCGVGETVEIKCKSLFHGIPLDPTQTINVVTDYMNIIEDDVATVLTSNCSSSAAQSPEPTSPC